MSRVYDRSWRSGTEPASVPVANLRVGELCGIRGRQVTGQVIETAKVPSDNAIILCFMKAKWGLPKVERLQRLWELCEKWP